jgi:hypothetical protein
LARNLAIMHWETDGEHHLARARGAALMSNNISGASAYAVCTRPSPLQHIS